MTTFRPCYRCEINCRLIPIATCLLCFTGAIVAALIMIGQDVESEINHISVATIVLLSVAGFFFLLTSILYLVTSEPMWIMHQPASIHSLPPRAPPSEPVALTLRV